MKQERQKYSREFKFEAVRLAEESERPLAQVARELGIHPSALRRWRIQANRSDATAGDSFPGNGKLSRRDEDFRRLQRENQLLRQERDFLKKAAAYFAKESR